MARESSDGVGRLVKTLTTLAASGLAAVLVAAALTLAGDARPADREVARSERDELVRACLDHINHERYS